MYNLLFKKINFLYPILIMYGIYKFYKYHPIFYKIFKKNKTYNNNKMHHLNEKAFQNLHSILNMKKDDIFIGKRGELTTSDEFIPLDNLYELEYVIYFTYNQLLNNPNNFLIYNNDLIQKIDLSIDNLYENKQFNDLFMDERIKIVINDIEHKLDHIKDYYYYKSPFFSCFRRFYNTFNYIKEIMKENNEYVTKMLKVTNYNIDEEDEEGVEDEGINQNKIEGGVKENINKENINKENNEFRKNLSESDEEFSCEEHCYEEDDSPLTKDKNE